MMEQWQRLNQRDRIALIGGSVVVLLYFIYLFVYLPITQAVNTGLLDLKEKKQTLVWMQAAKSQHIPKSPKVKLSRDKLLSHLSNTLKKSEFTQFPYQLQQTTDGNVELSFNEVPFNQFMTWLKNQNAQFTLVIERLVSTNTSTPGIVKLTVNLSATGDN